MIVTLILTILAIFTYLVALSNPSIQGIIGGYLPTSTLFETPLPGHESQLTLALGIVGATVMPHNLYLHSSLSQTRKINHKDKKDVRKAVRFKNTSKTVRRIAIIIGILNKRFKAIAEPKTSAKSVAIKANSKITHKL